MILAINSKKRAETSLALVASKPVEIKKEFFWKSKIGQTQKLLQKTNQFFKNNQVKLKDLKAIAVYQGPGSYTSLRVGISVANTLGWILDIPVIGIKYQSSKHRYAKSDKSQNFMLETRIEKISALEVAKQAASILQRNHLIKFKNIIIPYYTTRF